MKYSLLSFWHKNEISKEESPYLNPSAEYELTMKQTKPILSFFLFFFFDKVTCVNGENVLELPI
jgi:hypothetical protein